MIIGIAVGAGLSYTERLQAVVAQMVERVLGKDEVTGSIPVNGSSLETPAGPAMQESLPSCSKSRQKLKGSDYGEREI